MKMQKKLSAILVLAGLAHSPSLLANSVDYQAVGNDYKNQLDEVLSYQPTLSAAITNKAAKMKLTGHLPLAVKAVEDLQTLRLITTKFAEQSSYQLGMNLYRDIHTSKNCESERVVTLGVASDVYSCLPSSLMNSMGLTEQYKDVFVVQISGWDKKERVVSYVSGELTQLKENLNRLLVGIRSAEASITVNSIRTKCRKGDSVCQRTLVL